MNRIKLHVRKGDQVEVISGNHRGSTGKVLEVIARKAARPDRGRPHDQEALKKSQDNPQGKIAEREGPIHISNVKVVERGEATGREKAPRRKRRRKARRKRPAREAMKRRRP